MVAAFVLLATAVAGTSVGAFGPADQAYLLQARQMQALSFAAHIPLAGVATLALVSRWRFGPARVTAALAVAAIVAGWALAQRPDILPGLTVEQAAAGHSAPRLASRRVMFREPSITLRC
jgi:hypothetical protein